MSQAMNLQPSGLDKLATMRSKLTDEPLDFFASGSLFDSLALESTSCRPAFARRKKTSKKGVTQPFRQAPEPCRANVTHRADCKQEPKVINFSSMRATLSVNDSMIEKLPLPPGLPTPPGLEGAMTQYHEASHDLADPSTAGITVSRQLLCHALGIEFSKRANGFNKTDFAKAAENDSGSEDSASTAAPTCSTPPLVGACRTVDSLPEL